MENGNANRITSEATPEGVAPGFEQPVGMEQLPQQVKQEAERQLQSPEKATIEQLGQMGTEGVVPMMPSMNATGAVAIIDTGTVDDDNPDTAEDGEKIEREWAERVRKVIELTKDNPRTEQIEVNKLKADYMKKRFNRELGDRN